MIRKNDILTEIEVRHRKRIMQSPSKQRRWFNAVDVERIRISFLKDGATVAQLARDMDTSTKTINNILRGHGAYRYEEDMT